MVFASQGVIGRHYPDSSDPVDNVQDLPANLAKSGLEAANEAEQGR